MSVDKASVFKIASKFVFTEEPLIPDFNAQEFTEKHIKPLKFDEEFFDEFKPESIESFFSTFAVPILNKINAVTPKTEPQEDIRNKKDVVSPYTFVGERADETTKDPEEQSDNGPSASAFDDIFKNTDLTNTQEINPKETPVEIDNQNENMEVDGGSIPKETQPKEDIDKTLSDIDKFLSEVQI